MEKLVKEIRSISNYELQFWIAFIKSIRLYQYNNDDLTKGMDKEE